MPRIQLSRSNYGSLFLIHWVFGSTAILPSNCQNHCCLETPGPLDIRILTQRQWEERGQDATWQFGTDWIDDKKLLSRLKAGGLQWAGDQEQRQVALQDSCCFSLWGGTDVPFELQQPSTVWEPRTYDSHPWASCCPPRRLSLIRYLCWTYRVCRRSIKVSKNYLSLVFCILGKNTVCHHQVKILDFFCPTPSNWKFYLYNISGLSSCVPIISLCGPISSCGHFVPGPFLWTQCISLPQVFFLKVIIYLGDHPRTLLGFKAAHKINPALKTAM